MINPHRVTGVHAAVWAALLAGLTGQGCGAAAPATHSPQAGPLVQAQLLADVDSVTPGATFTIGVMLHIKKGWHVYWKYPGDSGLATQVDFKPPKAFKIGPVRYPAPRRFTQPGLAPAAEIVGFGYEDAVLLTAGVTAPADLPAGRRVTVAAEISWLACRETCVPGSAKLKLALPTAKQPAAANRKLFARWRQALPVEAGSSGAPFKATVRGRLSPQKREGDFAIILEGASVPRRLEWIYAGMDAIVIKAVRTRIATGRAEITFTAAVLPGMNVPSSPLETLVVYSGPGGLTRAVRIYVPLKIAADKVPRKQPAGAATLMKGEKT